MKFYAALVLLVTSTFAAGVAAVCFPEKDYSVAAEYRQSVAVVVGTVVSANHIPEANQEAQDAMSYRVSLDETLKGAPRETISIWSENSSGRFPMTVGSSYLLFVYFDGTHFVVDNCGNSGLASETEIVRNKLDELRNNL